MKFLYILIILISSYSWAQNSDWKILQAKIDSAVKVNGTVNLDRNYKLDKSLVAARWTGKDYGFFTIVINGNGHTISAAFKDAPLLAIHKAKGALIKDLKLNGLWNSPDFPVQRLYNTGFQDFNDSGSRDSQYSPYAGIAIDPFRGTKPADGGYPTLGNFYRGSDGTSGSTGIRVESSNISGFVVGFITSPNGKTLNAEIITIADTKISSCKVAIAGCQSQEKMNRVLNLEVNGPMHTVFMFNHYGQRRPGHWSVDGVKINGPVVRLVNRLSSGYFPLYISGVRSSSLGSIGLWQSFLSDALVDSDIIFGSSDHIKNPPDAILSGGGVIIQRSHLNYKNARYPIVIEGKEIDPEDYSSIEFGTNPPIIWKNYVKNPVINAVFIKKIPIKDGKMRLSGKAKIGDKVVFYEGNYFYQGVGVVESVDKGSYIVGSLSPGVAKGKANWAGIYQFSN